MDSTLLLSVVFTLVTLANFQLMPLNTASGAILGLGLLLGLWRGISSGRLPEMPSGGCGVVLISVALPLLALFGYYLYNPAMAGQYIHLWAIVYFCLYWPCRLFGSAYYKPKPRCTH